MIRMLISGTSGSTPRLRVNKTRGRLSQRRFKITSPSEKLLQVSDAYHCVTVVSIIGQSIATINKMNVISRYILSLFKSYKPELVPEKIQSVNIESVWKPIPEVIRLALEDARDRAEIQQSCKKAYFDWNVPQVHKKKIIA